MVGAFSPFPQLAGVAGGLYGCLQLLTGCIVSAVFTRITLHNQLPLALSYIGLAAAGLIIFYCLILRDAD